MIDKIGVKENSEMKTQDSNNYKEIKPQDGTNYSDSKQYWKETFSESNQTSKPKAEYFDDNGVKYRDESSLEPNKEFEKNGYTYKTDDMGRVVSAEGKLQLRDHEDRNSMPDSRDAVAHGKMTERDHRGHLIGDRFNGSSGLENLVPMDSKLNTGDYAKLENTLSAAVKSGADVRMKVEPVYGDKSYRPTEFKVSYSINGEKEVVVFKNGSDKK